MFSLNYRDARPIYEQVKDGLRHLVVTGAIQPGDQLPSVRALASSLAINPNTIQRAYESLEAEGYLYTMPGKGSYASEQTGVNQDRRRRLLEQFDAASDRSLSAGEDTAKGASPETGKKKKKKSKLQKCQIQWPRRISVGICLCCPLLVRKALNNPDC